MKSMVMRGIIKGSWGESLILLQSVSLRICVTRMMVSSPRHVYILLDTRTPHRKERLKHFV